MDRIFERLVDPSLYKTSARGRAGWDAVDLSATHAIYRSMDENVGAFPGPDWRFFVPLDRHATPDDDGGTACAASNGITKMFQRACVARF